MHPTLGKQFEITQQKAVDVGLAFHLMRSYGHRQWRKLFLAADDGDFHEAVQHLVANEDIDVFLVGTINSISDELKPYARDILRLDQRGGDIARP